MSPDWCIIGAFRQFRPHNANSSAQNNSKILGNDYMDLAVRLTFDTFVKRQDTHITLTYFPSSCSQRRRDRTGQLRVDYLLTSSL